MTLLVNKTTTEGRIIMYKELDYFILWLEYNLLCKVRLQCKVMLLQPKITFQLFSFMKSKCKCVSSVNEKGGKIPACY